MASSGKASEVNACQDEEKTRLDGRRVWFDWDIDASTSCGSERAEKCEADPNLLISSSGREQLREMSSEWTPMPRPLVVDIGAAETVSRRTSFRNHKTAESEGCKHGVPHDGRRRHCGKRRSENAAHVDSRWSTAEKVTFQVANVNNVHGLVSKIVRNGNRVASASYIENKMTEDVLYSEKEMECALLT